MASILVVDDEPDIRYLTQVTLELDGHRVMTAANGGEALAAVSVERPDLILCDVMMPEVDGWGVLEMLKSDSDITISEIPVLMMTALSSDDDQIRGGIEGAIRYLVKPVPSEELREAVIGALEGGPEIEQRRRAQTGALERLVRQETGKPADTGPRPRLTRLERSVESDEVRVVPPESAIDLSSLTEKQAQLLVALRDAESVSEAATVLGVSRSNIYASLRRINRKLGVDSVQDMLRSGHVLVVDSDTDE